MSRLGKLAIPLPAGVTVTITAGVAAVKGSKGEVAEKIPTSVKVVNEEGSLKVSVNNPDNSQQRALWGLARQLLANAVKGVSQGFSKSLELSGIGFKVQLEGQTLVLNLGFSHQVRYAVPNGVTAIVEKNTITISGANKQQVGQVAAEIRSLKKPEPYKGKGIKYSDEVIRRKAGKVVKSAGAK
ncbi:MAG: 50S ribosomal protein L6 [Candidatus Kerfeldbacteria bacterium]|nr:50S ribosomal protein L6 [Candidatus Kerfeldbacteria bacterium]